MAEDILGAADAGSLGWFWFEFVLFDGRLPYNRALGGMCCSETVEVTCRGVQNHSGINDFAVNDIYTAVVAALTTSPTRTFATEIAVFWSDWWSLANASMRDDA